MKLGETNRNGKEKAEIRYGHTLFIKYSLFSAVESGKIVGIS